jgi:hypothetical protein
MVVCQMLSILANFKREGERATEILAKIMFLLKLGFAF